MCHNYSVVICAAVLHLQRFRICTILRVEKIVSLWPERRQSDSLMFVLSHGAFVRCRIN